MSNELSAIRSLDPKNEECMDCGAAKPQWTSMNHGVYICLMCSGVHRSLGVQISFVKSVSMDAWNAKHLEIMQAGGNSKLREFFASYELNDLPIREKYCSVAADYYRKMLRATLEGTPLPPRPSVKDGQAMLVSEETRAAMSHNDRGPDQFAPRSISSQQSNVSTPQSVATGLAQWGWSAWDAVGSFASKAHDQAVTSFNSLDSETVVGKVGQGVVTSAAWMSEKSQTVLTSVKNDAFWNKASKTVQSTVATATETITKAVSKAAEIVEGNSDERWGTTTESTDSVHEAGGNENVPQHAEPPSMGMSSMH